VSGNYRSGLNKFVIHGSLVKPLLFMGGDRTLMICSMLISAYLGYLISMRYGPWYGVPIGVGVWTAIAYVVRGMAEADAQMWDIVKRAKRYRAFYPARGRFDAIYPVIRDTK